MGNTIVNESLGNGYIHWVNGSLVNGYTVTGFRLVHNVSSVELEFPVQTSNQKVYCLSTFL